MIYLLNLKVIVLFLLMSPRHMQPAAVSSDSKLSCARISADLDVAAEWEDSWGMLFNAKKSEHLHNAR